MSQIHNQGVPVTPPNRNSSSGGNKSSQYSGSPKSNADTTSSPETKYQLGIDPTEYDNVEDVADYTDSAVESSQPPSEFLALPDEMKLSVIRQLRPQSKETLNLALTVKELRWMALAQHWSSIGTENAQTLVRLETQDPTTQQNYAGLIQNLKVSTDLMVNLSACRFNDLRKLVVVAPNQSQWDLDLSTFLGPKLTRIELEVNANRQVQNPCIRNFLSVMNRSPLLKYIDFGLPFHHAQPADLLTALQSCTQIDTVYIRGHAEILMDIRVWKYLALNERLRRFYWTGLVNLPFLGEALQDVHRDQVLFSNVTHMCLTITTAAAAKVFPYLQNLTSLALIIKDHGDILQSVARLGRLKILQLEYELDTALTTATFAALKYMTLTKFAIRQDNRYVLDGSAIPLSALPHIFGSHATMERLEFAWQGSAYFDDNARDVLWALGRVYPNVKQCVLSAASLTSKLGPAKAYPPMWPGLRRLDLWEMIEPDDPDKYDDYCSQFANQILLHLPDIRKITVAHNKPFCSRIRREWIRIVEVGRERLVRAEKARKNERTSHPPRN